MGIEDFCLALAGHKAILSCLCVCIARQQAAKVGLAAVSFFSVLLLLLLNLYWFYPIPGWHSTHTCLGLCRQIITTTAAAFLMLVA